jgi:HSP20 family protein
MPKNKLSFLQRLTGAVGDEMAEETLKIKKGKSKIDEIEKDYNEEQDKIETKKEAEIFEEAQNEEIKPEPAKEESWLSESEGQLTIDVYQTPTDIIITSTIAGVKPEDLDITITNDMVTIKGERKKEESIKDEDYYYQECYWGKFSRSVILPVDVVSEKAEANMKNGILIIHLPKAEQLKTKKIKVKGL